MPANMRRKFSPGCLEKITADQYSTGDQSTQTPTRKGAAHIQWTAPRSIRPGFGLMSMSSAAQIPSPEQSSQSSQHPGRRSAKYGLTCEIATRSWAIVSRERIVTASSSKVSKSTVMQYGVPISS